MLGESLAPPGYYGKVPTRGDFVTRRLPRSFLDSWDSWLQRAVAASRSMLGEAWLDAYLTGPIWRFALGPGLCGEQAVAGLLMPSVDSVGRYYPMTIATLLEDRPNPFVLAAQGEAWFAAAEELALSCLEGEFDPDAFDEGLFELDLAGFEDGAPLPAALELTPPADSLLSWSTEQLDQDRLFSDAYPNLLDKLIKGRGEPYSLWWTTGSDRVPPSLRSYPGLPPEEGFTTFLQTADG